MFGFSLFPHNKDVILLKGGFGMKGKVLLGAVCCGAIIGSAAVVAIIPCCMNSRTKRKMLRYKNRMTKTAGSVLDAVSDFMR